MVGSLALSKVTCKIDKFQHSTLSIKRLGGIVDESGCWICPFLNSLVQPVLERKYSMLSIFKLLMR